jgi:RNase H
MQTSSGDLLDSVNQSVRETLKIVAALEKKYGEGRAPGFVKQRVPAGVVHHYSCSPLGGRIHQRKVYLRGVRRHRGCDGNPGSGGWAALLQYGNHVRELTGGEPATTNNRMELQAAIAALKSLKEPCAAALFTDSEYIRGGIIE